jgi:hypothetical protein
LQTKPSFNSVKSPRQYHVFIYPNPVLDVLHISTPNPTEKMQVRIYDVSGKLCLEDGFSGHDEIVLAQLDRGVYTVMISAENGAWVLRQRVIKG